MALAVGIGQYSCMSDGLREIRLFVATYEERSFTAAAQRENATQSGVSQHIRKLEDRHQVRLFTRGSGSVTPTPAGDTFYRRCIDMLRAHDEAANELRRFATGLDGEFSAGLVPILSSSVLAPTLSRFIESNPNSKARIIEANSDELTERVASGELGFAVVPAFPITMSLRSRLFVRTPEMLVVGRSAWPAGAGIGGRLCAHRPLKLVLPSRHLTRRRTIESYLASNDVHVDQLLELDAMLGMLDLVARTNWTTILPGVMVASEWKRDSFLVTPLEPALSLDLVLIESARRVLSPPEQEFLRILEEETRQVNRLQSEPG